MMTTKPIKRQLLTTTVDIARQKRARYLAQRGMCIHPIAERLRLYEDGEQAVEGLTPAEKAMRDILKSVM